MNECGLNYIVLRAILSPLETASRAYQVGCSRGMIAKAPNVAIHCPILCIARNIHDTFFHGQGHLNPCGLGVGATRNAGIGLSMLIAFFPRYKHLQIKPSLHRLFEPV